MSGCIMKVIFFNETQNHPAERLWVEVNQRVNYRTKEAINALVENDQLHQEDNITKFSLSWITTRLCQVGIQGCVQSWNHHPIQVGMFCLDICIRQLQAHCSQML